MAATSATPATAMIAALLSITPDVSRDVASALWTLAVAAPDDDDDELGAPLPTGPDAPPSNGHCGNAQPYVCVFASTSMHWVERVNVHLPDER
ncbi:hypothetical protein SDRG_16515 [Saprolegnia diclina VS20]|uniref:Uncharacterized protein n=1 Tax=Saprolegnia diclina (strain VS20) TaxID=1156394 RepID=T0PJQ5_SAPDV|nr:hypothetical protein SDRG_16515 [Saprolegnia diclina VS20]EQC25619.1 hypothetical protein SDRG_16515 [Saprolegnia diclina VS20]|eukprot:XP_008620951.1 hypothetical protein SDRG_16515 [Saprolegnia diclina VS20]